MRIFFLMFLAGMPLASAAIAETEYDFDTDLTLVASILSDESEGVETEGLMRELSFGGSASQVLENGVEVSGNFAFRLQSDHPNRAGFSGHIIECPPAFAGCPSLNGQGVRGAFSRISTLSFTDEAGPRGSLERAYIEIDGGWGALGIGIDEGVGARFYEGGPTVFTLARDHDPILDPTGINGARVRNDISSIGAKVSYVTPRILGLRAGLSYTPDAGTRGLDLDTDRRAPGVIEPELDDVIEVGLQFSRLLRSADLRVRSSLTWSQANSASSFYSDTSTTSFGLEFERRDVFRVGFSLLSSDNGGFGDYSALSAGGEWYVDGWAIGVNGVRAEDDAIGFTSQSVTVGASHEINDMIDFTIGYRDSETDFDLVNFSAQNSATLSGVLLEVRIQK